MFLSLPPATGMFRFAGFPPRTLYIHVRVAGHYSGRVAPFGNPWFDACLRLPMAYRSLPRPSSAPDAKASTVRSFLA